MTSRKIIRSLAMGAALALASTSALVSTPAHAQFGGIVYDPSNYAQNVLTAARTLEQINNQIRMLQNQATSLINEAKNDGEFTLYVMGTTGVYQIRVDNGVLVVLLDPKPLKVSGR